MADNIPFKGTQEQEQKLLEVIGSPYFTKLRKSMAISP